MDKKKQKQAKQKKIAQYANTKKKKQQQQKKRTEKPKSEPETKSTITSNNQLELRMFQFNLLKKTSTRHINRNYNTKMDFVVTQTIVKTKAGGFSLKVTKVPYKIFAADKSPAIGVPEITYLKTTGLLKYLAKNIAWGEDMTFLPRRAKRKYGTEGQSLGKTQIKGTQSTQKIRTKIPKSTVENTISEYSPDIGMKIGSDIHNEIEKFIKHGADIFQKICPNPDPRTVAILLALGERKYIGSAAEYPVYFYEKDNDALIASAVDFVCVLEDAYKRLNVVLVELKTGYANGAFYTSFQKKTDEILHNKEAHNFNDRQMLNKFSDLKDTPLNRGRIQLVTYMYYFRKKLEIECSGTVLHCSTDGVVKFFDIDEGFYQKYSKAIRNYLYVK